MNDRQSGVGNVSGVNYGGLDRFKAACMQAAAMTAGNAQGLGVVEVSARGLSAHVISVTVPVMRGDDRVLINVGSVIEGIGTKPEVARIMQEVTGKNFWAAIGQDNLSSYLNDAITCGIFPCVAGLHVAVADASWFDDVERANELIRGTKEACDKARCIWGPGETPALKDIIVPGAVELSGFAVGLPYENRLIEGNIQPGDAIVFLRSSGIMINGLTKARDVADQLPDGYLTVLEGIGLTYGEALLQPTPIYVPVIEDAMIEGLDLHGVINISGHGLRKLMRYEGDFTYEVNELFGPHPEFGLIASVTGYGPEKMYAGFNMGQGMAVMLPADQAGQLIEISQHNEINALLAGTVKEGKRQVRLNPVNVVYDTLWEG